MPLETAAFFLTYGARRLPAPARSSSALVGLTSSQAAPAKQRHTANRQQRLDARGAL